MFRIRLAKPFIVRLWRFAIKQKAKQIKSVCHLSRAIGRHYVKPARTRGCQRSDCRTKLTSGRATSYMFVFQGRCENAAVKPGLLPRRLDDTGRDGGRRYRVRFTRRLHRIEFPRSFRQFRDRRSSFVANSTGPAHGVNGAFRWRPTRPMAFRYFEPMFAWCIGHGCI